MRIFKCSVSHRTGAINDCIRKKVLFIKADDPVAAYMKAEMETRGINHQVYPPVIEEWEPPCVDFECRLDDVEREYGTLAVDAAKNRFSIQDVRKTKNGTRE